MEYLDLVVELQALAQAGLQYGADVYDLERYRRIREISARLLAQSSDLPLETVRDLFCCETGYQTPKLDSRAAIFQEDKILLVQEKSGAWALPGGWVDVNLSIAESTVKEAKEEAGLDVTADLLIAVQNWQKHNVTRSAWKICKVFFLCTLLGGAFQENSETLQSGWFTMEDLPPLSLDKTTPAQLQMCFAAHASEHWVTQFD